MTRLAPQDTQGRSICEKLSVTFRWQSMKFHLLEEKLGMVYATPLTTWQLGGTSTGSRNHIRAGYSGDRVFLFISKAPDVIAISANAP